MTKEEAIKILHPISDEYCQMANIRMTQAEDDICEALDMAIEALKRSETPNSSDCIDRQAAIDALDCINGAEEVLRSLPSAQPEIIRCRECKHWKQQTNYAGAPLSFGFCESDDMWRSLYGETYEVSHIDTDDDFYCGYAERRTDG